MYSLFGVKFFNYVVKTWINFVDLKFREFWLAFFYLYFYRVSHFSCYSFNIFFFFFCISCDMWQLDRHNELRRHIQMASAVQRNKSFHHQASIIYNGRKIFLFFFCLLWSYFGNLIWTTQFLLPLASERLFLYTRTIWRMFTKIGRHRIKKISHLASYNITIGYGETHSRTKTNVYF